ncbi:CBS domain-containing protein [Desulfopila aestuarii]|uniref:CBS domain-containing protein n=1 Tax=Desulfopila aestuarii DSM 18488 TaxID=1121416 RepID=A0A1M7XZS0_9BACT|nr:CBS domain-containing protein [Desulfopila aestuarii]SHO44734.1 CBS domain-containing protein [Desulfopila aestuarii DSM 18488]
MKAKEILDAKGTRVITVIEDSLIVDVMAIFFANKVGSLLVVDKYDNILGIVAPNDILKAVHQNLDRVPEMRVSEVMVSDLIVATPEDDLDYIQNIMTENRVRHIPILDDGKLIGLVSIGDVVKAQMTIKNVENRYLKDYIEGKYPA